jgi:hypothetical protein
MASLTLQQTLSNRGYTILYLGVQYLLAPILLTLIRITSTSTNQLHLAAYHNANIIFPA